MSPSSDPKEFVLQLKENLHLDQTDLEKPTPERSRMIRCFAETAKDSKRIDVVKHLREITPAGTTGEFACSIWSSVNSFIHELDTITKKPVMFTVIAQHHSFSQKPIFRNPNLFAGPLLPGKLDVRDIPVEKMRELTIDLTGKFDKKCLES